MTTKNLLKKQKNLKKALDKTKALCYNKQVVKIRPVGQAVKTLASHAGNMGSIPVRVTKKRASHLRCSFFCLLVEITQRVFAHAWVRIRHRRNSRCGAEAVP